MNYLQFKASVKANCFTGGGIILMLAMVSCASKRVSSTGEDWNYQSFRASQKSFNSSDGTIKYLDEGIGSPILLLHGVPSSSWLYRKMIDDLVEAGHRVIAPDMLGFGSSDNPDGYEIYSAERHATRIIDLMDSLQIENWSHVMHDAGGMWTWELLKQDPTKINHLVILNSCIYEEGFTPPVRMKEGGFAKFSMWLYRRSISRSILMKQLFKKTLVDKKMLTKNEIEGYKVPLREGKTNGMYHFFSKTKSPLPLYESVLMNFHSPTLVIWGKHDDMLQWSPQELKVVKDLTIPPENIHLIDAKHFIQEEQPAQIDSLILNFIDL